MRTIIERLTAVSVLLLASQITLAGPPTPGSITFAPVATSVPALGTAALIMLALLLGFIGWVSLRKSGPGVMPNVALALSLAALASAGGLQILDRATAAGSVYSIAEPGVQTFPINPSDVNQYDNNSGVDMRATSVTLPPALCVAPTGDPLCEADFQLAPGESCNINCTAPSDRRLKTDIARVGTAPNGLALYEYRYHGDTAIYLGVMAQDVLFHTPGAVHLHSNGYLAVDYSAVSLRLTRIR